MSATYVLIAAATCLAFAALALLFWRKWTMTSAELAATKTTLEDERKRSSMAKDQLQDTFKSLASQALEGNTKQFLELAKAKLDQETTSAKGDIDKRKQAITELVQPLKETLDKYQQHMRELERERQRSYTTVESELKRVTEASVSLSRETTALKDALKKPHVRGRWGEVQLKNCIELAGMSEYADVTFQDTNTQEDGSRLIPDMTVKMPGNRLVVVDSKTPVDAFLASLEAKSEEERHAEMIRHGQHIKNHVKALSTKAYAQKISESADFTVMFLPNESFLYAALETQADLVEYALEKKILIATPPTLVGLLKVIRFGWNEEKLAENALMISEAGKELHKRVCDFMTAYTNVGKHLEKASSEYQVGLTRLESRVLTQARRLEKLGAKSRKSLPASQNLTDEENFEGEAPEVLDSSSKEPLDLN